MGTNCSAECLPAHIRNVQSGRCELCTATFPPGSFLADPPSNCTHCTAWAPIPSDAAYVGGAGGGCRWLCATGFEPRNGKCMEELTVSSFLCDSELCLPLQLPLVINTSSSSSSSLLLPPTILSKLLLLLRRGSPSRRLGLVCAGATRQRVVLASPVTAGNKHLLLLVG